MRLWHRGVGAFALSASLALGPGVSSLADSADPNAANADVANADVANADVANADVADAHAADAYVWDAPLEYSHILIQTSLYTSHFSSDPEHTNNQQLIGLELHSSNRWFAGGARFKNSFDQASVFLYAGREFPFWTSDNGVAVRGKLAAGLLQGYRGEYQDKIPFNHFGIAPAALPGIGVRWGHLESDVLLFGTAGLMLVAGLRF